MEKRIGNIFGFTGGNYAGNVYDQNYIAPTLNVMQGGYRQPMIAEEGVCKIESQYRIRKLTPLECWRLMNFTDEDFHKAEAVNSNTQLYKQAGNSIVVSVLESLFRQLCIQNIPTWNEERARNEVQE